MADKHISFILIDVFPSDQSVQCFIIRKIISIFICSHHLFHHGWFYKRKQIKIHFSILIFQRNLFDRFTFRSRRLSDHVHFLPGKHLSETIHSRCTVMISADHHNHRRRHGFCQFPKKPVKNLNCLCGRNRLIINVPCDHNGIRFFLGCRLNNFRQNIFLIFTKIPVHQLQSNMQI